MAGLVSTTRRTLLSSGKTLIRGLRMYRQSLLIQSQNAYSTSILQFKSYGTDRVTKSPFDSNILRILRNEIQYQLEYAPPHEPVTRFNSFTVQDQPGEQWMTMRGKYGDSEDIKIEVTMFDGFETVPEPGEDISGQDIRLHISLLVDISRGEGCDGLEFLCSAWPDCLEIQKLYVLKRDKKLGRPYMGPTFSKLNDKLQKTLRQFLEARGINNELSVFLHEYMMNKDRIELIQWLGKVRSFVEE